MTLMVAGVNGAREADLALTAGADVIDVIRIPGLSGTPGEGVAGAVNDVVTGLRGRCPVSVTTGVGIDDPGRLVGVVDSLARAGAAYVKQDVGPSENLATALRVLTPFAGRTTLIAVLAP